MEHSMTRLNEAEWLIEPFFECQQRGFSWTFTADAGVRSRYHLDWQAVSISWESAPASAVVARLERQADLDLADTDRLCLRLAHADDQRVTVRAVVDGESQLVVNQAVGSNCFAEYEGPMQGTHLEHITIEIATDTGGDGQVNLLWLNAVSSAARDRYRRQSHAYDREWPVFLRNDDPDLKPRLGLLLPDGVDKLRQRISMPAYAPAWQQICQQAESFLNSQPEMGIREHFARPGGGGNGRYEHDLGCAPRENEAISTAAMQACSLVGLADNDARLARIALRHALAAAHCTHWDDSFMMTRPGALWDHRAFTPMDITNAFVSAIDWAGALLTDAGIDLVARAISMKTLPKVDYSLRKYAYMRGNNQAIFFASTGILAVCALGRLMDRGGDGLDWYVDVLRETVEHYFLPDGGTYEGIAYHDASASRALTGFAVAARFWNTPLDEVVPAALLRSSAYYRVMASTAFPGGCINTSDGGRVGNRCSGGAVPFLARMTKDKGLEEFTAVLCQADQDNLAQGTIPLLVNGPNRLPEPKLTVPTFDILKNTGMLCSCRPANGGVVRLQLVGAKANAGHGHEDKGSLVLEAFGEELLIDRGTCFYGDARSELLKHAWRHNMLTPDDVDGRPMHQVNPLPEPLIPQGSGDETTMRAHIDTSAGWADTLVQASRTIVSESPTAFELTDSVCRRDEGTVSLHFQSRSPWIFENGKWVSRGDRARVAITPLWDVEHSDAKEDLFDSMYTPVYRLSLRTKPGLTFDLPTTIEVEPCG